MKMAKRLPKKPRLPRPITVTEIIFENLTTTKSI
jgi:hypothetical protein